MRLRGPVLGLLGLVVILGAGTSRPQGRLFDGLSEPLRELGGALRSPQQSERRQALAAAGHFRAEVIRQAIACLEQTLEAKPDAAVPWGLSSSPEETAVMVLGEMRAAEAVPVLIRCLDRPWPRPSGEPTAVQLALADVGLPAKDALIEYLAAGRRSRYPMGLHTLDLICGRSAARFYVQEAMAKETDPQKKANLQAALDYLQKER